LVFFESVALALHVLLLVIGLLIVIVISRVYNLYQTLKINRSVMTPMLFAGFFTAMSGITELIEPYVGEIGTVAHALAMFLTAVFFIYGIYGYHQMLNKAVKLR